MTVEVHAADRLKEISKICEPDPRISLWGNSEELLSSLHRSLNKISLESYVDAKIIQEFEKAKNIVLFSFYSYSMSSVALLHAYACVEKAIFFKAEKLQLISKSRKDKNSELLYAGDGLRKKIEFALSHKWIGKKHFYIYDSKENEHSKKQFSQRLNSWGMMRNSLAHNPNLTLPIWQIADALKLFANIINAVSKGGDIFNDEVPEINLPKRKVDAYLLIKIGREDLLEFS